MAALQASFGVALLEAVQGISDLGGFGRDELVVAQPRLAQLVEGVSIHADAQDLDAPSRGIEPGLNVYPHPSGLGIPKVIVRLEVTLTRR